MDPSMIKFVFDMISSKNDKKKEGWQDPVAAYGESLTQAPAWTPQAAMPAVAPQPTQPSLEEELRRQQQARMGILNQPNMSFGFAR